MKALHTVVVSVTEVNPHLYNNKTSENSREGIRNETSIESGEQVSKLRIHTHMKYNRPKQREVSIL